jgi:hypothetical protein
MSLNAAVAPSQAHNLAQLYNDIEAILDWTQDEIYALAPQDVEALQLHWVQRRFTELRPRVRALDMLASDLQIDRIWTLDDVVPLCFPHTIFKGYTVADIEKRRFDRLTRWLDTLTIHDLSKVDSSDVDSLNTWIRRLKESTPLEPLLSSGTSGKVSVQPKTMREGKHLLMGMVRGLLPYGDEPGLDARTGDATYVSPWPARSGPHSITMKHTNMVRHIFGGDEDKVITLGQQEMSADELWLSGRLRRAQMRGEDLQLSAGERVLVKEMAERATLNASPEFMDRFVERAVSGLRGRKMFTITTWQRLYEMAKLCKQKGLSPDYAPGSVIGIGGGDKNWVFPEGWRELIDEVFPYPRAELYAMSEFSAIARLCAAGHWHAPAWGVSWIVDPTTSKIAPRSGVQTGRYVCFDLLTQSYWPGTLSGDRVTMHWDGGCSCGRSGPYSDREIRRFTEAEGGDDKISCAKTPDAYANLAKFTLGDVNVG